MADSGESLMLCCKAGTVDHWVLQQQVKQVSTGTQDRASLCGLHSVLGKTGPGKSQDGLPQKGLKTGFLGRLQEIAAVGTRSEEKVPQGAIGPYQGVLGSYRENTSHWQDLGQPSSGARYPIPLPRGKTANQPGNHRQVEVSQTP